MGLSSPKLPPMPAAPAPPPTPASFSPAPRPTSPNLGGTFLTQGTSGGAPPLTKPRKSLFGQ